MLQNYKTKTVIMFSSKLGSHPKVGRRWDQIQASNSPNTILEEVEFKRIKVKNGNESRK